MIWVDGDVLIYKAGFTAERTHYILRWYDPKYFEDMEREFRYHADMKQYLEEHHCPDHTVEKVQHIEPLSYALRVLKQMINTIQENCGGGELTICLSGDGNFREGVAVTKPYKGNREGKPKPTYTDDLIRYMQENYTCIVSEGEEADDVMGYSQYALYVQGEYSVIASIDKDLLMIPGSHYNFDSKELTEVTEDEADTNFWYQMVVGDTVDNIPGCRGCGARAAQDMIEESQGYSEIMEALVMAAYEKAYGDEWQTVMSEQAQLLWIRREPGQMKEIDYGTTDN